MVDLQSLSTLYLNAQLAGDRREAVRLIMEEGAAAGATPQQLLTDVVLPAQREIGRLWQENQISIADEHVATAISQLASAQIYGLAARHPARGKRIVMACVEGELHEIGARIAADLLDLEGYDVQFAGANVPVTDMPKLVTRYKPDLVVLTVTMSFHAGALKRSVAAIRQSAGPGLPIAAGGHAFKWTPELGQELGLVATGITGTELVRNVNAFFGA